MDETLETMLRALELDAPSVADRVSALEALSAVLPQLAGLSPEEWDMKFTSIEDDVAELGEAADRAVGRFEQGRRALETLKRFAQDRGAVAAYQHSILDEGSSSDADGRKQNPIAQAVTTRQAILQAMARRPHREWTPTAITDELMRYGRRVARSNVQVTLRRLAEDAQVRKVGRGTYQLLGSSSDRAGAEARAEPGAAVKPAGEVAMTASGRWTQEAARERARKAAATRKLKQEAGGG